MTAKLLLFVAAVVVCSGPLAGAEPTASATWDESAETTQHEYFTDTAVTASALQVDAGEEDVYAQVNTDANGRQGSILDRFLPRSHLPFPLLKGLVEGRDMQLPPPLGTSVIFTELDRHVAVSDVRLALGAAPPTSAERVDVPTTTFHASTQVARIDLWVLPFMNLYGIIGHTRSTGNVEVTVNRFPLPASPPVVLDIPVDLRGTTAGYGVTSGIGGKSWFATLDFNQTWTDFTQLDSALTALVLTPRVGLIIDQPWFKGEIHVGAMWQDTAQTVELTVNHPILGPDLHVEVDQYEPNPWNFLIGGLWALDERIQVIVEGGMGGRSYIVTGIILRH